MSVSLISKLLLDKTTMWFKRKGGTQSVAGNLVVSAVVAVFLIYMYYKLTSGSKKLAKVLHERDMLIEDAKRAEAHKKLEEITKDTEKYYGDIDAVDISINLLNKEIKGLKEEHEFNQLKINAIENWDDMDNYLSSIRDS